MDGKHCGAELKMYSPGLGEGCKLEPQDAEEEVDYDQFRGNLWIS